MITPRFKLTQDDSFLIVTIHAPYTNVKDAEIEYDEKMFLFNSKPYFLRLYLPCEVACEMEEGKTSYDSELGIFTIHVPKKNKGEHFPNLDMLSELIKPQRVSAERLISELPSTSQNLDELENEESVCHLYGYGFASQRHGILGKFIGEIGSLIDVMDPENFAIDSRSDFCRELDEEKFDPEYYLSDLFTPDSLQNEAMEFELTDTSLQINDLDREQLKDLPIRFLGNLSSETNYHIALSLIDICFAFAYDLRTNTGEHTVESGWTIAKLAPTLSVLACWQNVHEALTSAVRRSLVYPVCRNWELSMKVVEDLEKILTGGRLTILHCLLEIRKIFNHGGEFRYLFNQLYINDYCLWVQSVDASILDNLNIEFQESKTKVDKFSMGLDLEYIEAEAKLKMLELETCGESVVNLVESELENEFRVTPKELEEKDLVDSDDDLAPPTIEEKK
uniref:Protein SHQ1 homolog n=1 Tax=Acrobeloides nanus TaxID=290746 RepID=A0A914ELW4_9BILA